MRTLVEQTQTEVKKWLQNLLNKPGELGMDGESLKDLKWLAEHSPIILMGGEELDDARREWDIHPERPAILIGTQDMFLSRALSRGSPQGHEVQHWLAAEAQLLAERKLTQVHGFQNRINFPSNPIFLVKQ